jgi:hypothetical protein
MTNSNQKSSIQMLQDAYAAGFISRKGDIEGQASAQSYLNSSTAIYHDNVIDIGFLPKVYDTKTLRFFDQLVRDTYAILEKVTQRFIEDAGYRALFGFSPLLERLVCLPCGYSSSIPIMRMDIFLDEQDLSFRFCEFNTDGASAMNEDREGTAALSRSGVFKDLAPSLRLQPQELFEGWVDQFLSTYAASDYADKHSCQPTVAIADYSASATAYEFEEFRRRFLAHGLQCIICEVRELEFRDGCLYGYDRSLDGSGSGSAVRIDAVYRRAVTGEVLAELEKSGASAGLGGAGACAEPEPTGAYAEPGPTGACTDKARADAPQGALALVQAVEQGAVCMIGGFKTHVAHSKQLFSVLHLPQTAAFLTAAEQKFVKNHIPYTTSLKNSHIDIGAVKLDKDSWIIKPEDGYASKGVHAGIDKSQAEWAALIDECSQKPYIIQSYCRQWASANSRLGDGSDRLEDWNILTGLFAYNGRFSGVYVRAGQQGIIAGFAGGITVPVFLSDYHSDAGLAVRTLEMT